MSVMSYNLLMKSLRKTVRPKAHAAPRENMMYRTFGSIYCRGKYHVFFEHFPFGLYSSHRYIGHAESDDLVFWKARQMAIYPTKADDMDGAYEGSCIENEGVIWLFYVGIVYMTRDENDINSYVQGTPIKTNLMYCPSLDNQNNEYDNVKSKETIYSDEDFVKMGFASGTIKDPEAYKVDEDTIHITFLGKDRETGIQAVGFIRGKKKNDGVFSYEYIGRKLLDDKSQEIRTIKFFQSEGNDLVVMEANFPRIYADRPNHPDFKVLLGKGNLDFENRNFEIDYNSIKPFDYGFDMRAPKVAYDTRGLPYIMCSMKMTHDIKGAMGMISLPRRVEVREDGEIVTFIHPLIAERMTFRSKDQKIRQTHFPLLIKVTLNDGASISIGKLGIYRTNGVLHVDRRKIPDNSKEGHVRVELAKLETENEATSLRIFLDQDIAEIEVDQKKLISFVTFGDDTSIVGSSIDEYSTFTMSQTKV